MIKDVVITSLRKIPDERGSIAHMLRSDAKHFIQFGEIYFSTAYPGVIKGWHEHKKQIQNYAVIQGMIKLVLFDNRKESSTFNKLQELFIGDENYCLVTVPPLVWNGFKGVGTIPSIVANCASIPHDPNEIVRKSAFDKSIPYDWGIKHK